MKKLTGDQIFRRDKVEKLATCHCEFTRCVGGHITPAGFVCHHCDSNEPSAICFKEKVRVAGERPEDYTDPKVRRKVRTFDVISQLERTDS